ncbi:MAG: selenocysteine-specific translation elongation factor [Acidobacteria bacterium]|nr:selenocysteine-specific translation elongation factor [Acidobacteriota bacterium]
MRHLVVGTAGHIDHGKSALVQALTGIDPDRLKEEKARGITIDLGFAHARIEGVQFAFVDVPGHERFVKNMLAGASGIDAVLLVIAADESVMPQTREHFDICRLLHVGGGVIALTKADLVDDDTLELVRLETRELVAGSFLETAPIVPVSSRTGAGLPELRHALVELARSLPARYREGATRLPIDRAFTVRGFGTVVTGTLASGDVSADQELIALPGGHRVKVRGVQVHGRAAAAATAGQRTAVNLGGVELEDIARGDVLTAPGTFGVTRQFDATVELIAGARPLGHGARIRFHHGTSEILGRVALSWVGGTDTAPSEIKAGQRGYMRFRLENPAVLTRGDRFIVRAYSPPVTIGGGEVLDPFPPRGRIRSESARQRLTRLDRPTTDEGTTRDRLDEAIASMIDDTRADGLPMVHLTSRAGVAPDAITGIVDRLVRDGRAVRAGDVLVAPEVMSELKQKLVREIEAHHQTQPLSEGLPREEARERLLGRAATAVFEKMVTDLVADGRIVAREHLALTTYRVSLSGDEARARDTIERTYREAGLKPPDISMLGATTGIPAGVVDRVTKLLVRQRVLVKVDTLLFDAGSLERLKKDVRGLKSGAESPRVDVGTFKERYGVTRKFAIPLLEYLDRERVTRRVGEGRIVL